MKMAVNLNLELKFCTPLNVKTLKQQNICLLWRIVITYYLNNENIFQQTLIIYNKVTLFDGKLLHVYQETTVGFLLDICHYRNTFNTDYQK